MKKKDTKARMQIIFGALILALFFSAELYMMINYSDKYLIIAGIALVELIFLYVIIQGIFTLKDEKEVRNEEQYDNVFKSEKASYLMLKKYFEEFEDKLNYLEKASKIPTEEIVNAQKGIAKVIMNRNREGSEAMISTTEQIAEQLTEVQKQSEALQSLLASCKDEIIVSQKAAGDSSEKSVQMQIQDLVVQMKDMELRLNAALSQNQKVVVSQPQVSVPVAAPVVPQPAPQNHMEETPVEPEISPEPEESMEPEPEISPELEENPEPEILPDLEESLEPEISPELEESPEPEILPDIPEEENLKPEEDLPVMAADEIIPPDPEESIEEAEELVEPDPIPEDAIVEEANDENLPEEELSPMPDLSDPNRAMSPDEIAALFANMGNDDNADKAGESAEETVEPEDIPEPIEEPEAVKEAPLQPEESADPNKALSPDEIAALFASMGT